MILKQYNVHLRACSRMSATGTIELTRSDGSDVLNNPKSWPHSHSGDADALRRLKHLHWTAPYPAITACDGLHGLSSHHGL